MEVRTLMTVLLSTALLGQAQNSQKEYLDPHNSARSEVGVGRLSWDKTLEAYAVDYSQKRSADCQLVHSGGPYGENIYIGWGEGYSDATAAMTYWLNEKPYYSHQLNQCLGGVDCLHYTQIVWSGTTRVGCGRAECAGDGGKFFITCSYNPPGNIDGQRPY